ncbi:glycosyltransferase family 4 protein [Burkholderia vietnamiensis]|uniref:glycosyltransferase family 4 protein n=1 Tax=Burkholderia vietnamiensis TaxID=60552 RepID=UPI0009BD438A|nr:glycosyltransferase family 4 protein [Burkholderia vietnamiensis]
MSRQPQLFAELNAPYYVVAPPFNVNSGGIRAMHTLCHALNLAGEEAYVAANAVSTTLRTPMLTDEVMQRHRMHNREPIVIYPEVVNDNPMNARHVVRYLLNIPGFLNKGEVAWGADDIVYAHGTDVVPAGMHASLLQVPLVDTRIFNTAGVDDRKRSGNLLFINRYLAFGGQLSSVTSGFTEISFRAGTRSPEQLARLYRSAEFLYTYEASTACYEALMCGCPVVYLPNDIMLRKPMHNYLTNAGSAWGNTPEQIEHARRTVRDIPAIYEAINQSFWRELETFVDTTQRKVRASRRAATPAMSATAATAAAAKKRVAVLSAEPPGAAEPTIRFAKPLALLAQDWELIWGVKDGEIKLDDIRHADLIVLDRAIPGMLPIDAQAQLFGLGKPVVYATDALLNALPEHHPQAARRAQWQEGIEYAAHHAHAILVSTDQLAQAYGATGRPITVLPERVDFDLFYRPVRETGDTVRIGVLGTSLEAGNFSLVDGALRDIHARYGDRIELVFIGHAKPDGWDVHAQFIPLEIDYEKYAASLRDVGLDIVLVPLSDNAFNHAGSPVRFLEYAACGIAAVVSDVAPYRALVRQECNGLRVADTAPAWTEAIARLIEQPALRRQLARTAQVEIRKHHGLSAHRAAFQQALARCLDPQAEPTVPPRADEPITRGVLILDPDGDAERVATTLRQLRHGAHAGLVAVVLTTQPEGIPEWTDHLRYVTTTAAEYANNVAQLSALANFDWVVIMEAGEALMSELA